MRVLLAMIVSLAVSGCLSTPRPVFNDHNSVAAGESAAFIKLVEAWEAEIGTADSPRDMVENGDRVVDLDGLIVIEDRSNGFAQYMAVGLTGKRVMMCLVHHKKIEEIGARHDVTLKVDLDAVSDPTFPAPITADGGDEALYAFVIDAFTDGLLICQSPSDLVRNIS